MKQKPSLILFLNSFWNNHSGLSGGDQMMTQIYQRNFHHYQTIYCFTSPDGKTIFPKTVKNLRYILSHQNWDRWQIVLNYFARTIKAFSCLQIKDIQLIHSSSDFLPDVMPALIYKLRYPQTKWVVNVMHIYPSWKNRPGNILINAFATFMQRLSLLLIQSADVVITLNQSVKQTLVSLGNSSSKIKIIPAGIDYDIIKKSKAVSSPRKYDAIFMGRLKPSKGIFDLAAIWQAVMAVNPKLKLGIIGGGGDSSVIKQLKSEINERGLSQNVFLLGFLESTTAYSLIKSSQVFISPSHEEGFGIAIAEALACGKPVIVWDIPIYHEIYGSHLSYVPENNIDEFGRCIIEHSAKSQDSNKKNQLSQEFVKKFSWDQVAERYRSILTL